MEVCEDSGNRKSPPPPPALHLLLHEDGGAVPTTVSDCGKRPLSTSRCKRTLSRTVSGAQRRHFLVVNPLFSCS